MALTTQVGLEFIARNKANRTMLAYGNSIKRIRYRLRGLATSILAVAGVGGFGYMIKRQMEVIDSTAKLSDRLNITTENLIAMQHGAKIAGVQSETFNKSLEIFVRHIGEVDMGVGQATYALDKLGLNYKKLIGLSADVAFGRVANQIKALATQAEKAAAANYLFGRSGQQLLNFFEKGSQGLKEYKTFVEKTGLAFSRFDASQVEAANDALTNARAAMTGLFRQATIQLAPHLEILAKRFTDFATAGEGVGTNVVNAFESMSIAAIRFGSTIQTLPAYWKGVEAAAHLSLASVYELADKATNLDILFKKLKRPGWEKTYKELAQQERQIAAGLLEAGGKQLAGTYGQENAVRQYFKGLRKAAKGRALLESSAPGVGLGIVDSQVEETATIDIAVAYRKMYGDMGRMTMESYRFRSRAIEDLKQKYIDSGLARVQVELWYLEQVKKIDIERLRSSQNLLDGLKAAGEQMEMEMKSWGQIGYEASMIFQSSFANAFADVIMRMKTVDDAFRYLMRSIARSVISNIGANIAGAMFSRIFIGGSMAAARGMPTVGTVTPSAGATFAKFHHGGWATGPTMALLGEKEPELVTPLSKLRGGSGGDTIINITNTGTPQQVVSFEQRDAEDQRIIDVVFEDVKMGGMLKQSITEVIRND